MQPNSFPLILAADPIYSSDHPRLLVQTIEHHLSKSKDARFIVELPLRELYAAEREDLKQRLESLRTPTYWTRVRMWATMIGRRESSWRR